MRSEREVDLNRNAMLLAQTRLAVEDGKVARANKVCAILLYENVLVAAGQNWSSSHSSPASKCIVQMVSGARKAESVVWHMICAVKQGYEDAPGQPAATRL